MSIDDQALKDALRAIESGEIPEDLDLPDPEDYDDMGGIKSLDMGAPNNKTAGMGKVMEMFSGPYGFDRDGFEDNYMNFMDYKDGGGDMGIVEFTLNAFDMVKGKEKAPSIKMASETPDEEAELMLMMEEFQKQEELKKQLEKDREQAMYGGSMRAKYNDGTPKPFKPTEMESILKNRERSADQQKMAKEIKLQNQIKIPERLSRMEKDYPDAMKKKYKFMELIQDDQDDIPDVRPGQQNSIEDILRMLKESEEKKKKRAKGGIAGVL
jgi:hypothetical protein